MYERHGALGALGKTDGTGTTAYLNDAIRQKMVTLSPTAYGDAYLRATVAASGTATGSGATSLTDSTAPFVASGLIGAVAQAATSLGVLTYMVITSNTTSVLTGSGGWNNGTPSTTSAYVVSFGYAGKLLRIDPQQGYLYVSPVFPAATGAGVGYEISQMGIKPDDHDRARDRALTDRCTRGWQEQVLTVLPEAQEWRIAAYSGALGGTSDATAAAQTMAFPTEYFQQSMLVTNSGSLGYVSSPSYYVQPNDQYRVTGWVSTRAQTSSVRVRRVTSTAADITPDGGALTFTLRGWQYFDFTFTVPSGCSEVQLWAGGASASCIAEFAGIALIPVAAQSFTLPARVRNVNDVACVYARTGDAVRSTSSNAMQSANKPGLEEIVALRKRAGAGVRLEFPAPLPPFGIVWEERHYYTALQSAYMTATDRVTGDTTPTDCPLEYVVAGTVCELLEGRVRTAEGDEALLRATMDLGSWDDQFSPVFKTPAEITRGAPVLRRL